MPSGPGPGWPGFLPGNGPEWHHNRNIMQEGSCPKKEVSLLSCTGWKDDGNL